MSNETEYYMSRDFRSEDEGGPSEATKALGEDFGVVGDLGTALFRLSSELGDINERAESAEVIDFVREVTDALAGPLAAWATLIDRAKAALDAASVCKIVRQPKVAMAGASQRLDADALKYGDAAQ